MKGLMYFVSFFAGIIAMLAMFNIASNLLSEETTLEELLRGVLAGVWGIFAVVSFYVGKKS